MTESFGTKILPRIGRIGPEEFGGQATHGDHMHRIIRWSASGFHWEADPNYSRQIVERWHCALPFAGSPDDSVCVVGDQIRHGLPGLPHS